MNRIFKKMAMMLTAILTLIPSLALAAGGGGAAIVLVADTRRLPAFEAWWANLYNESHVYFTLATVIIIPIVGVIFGVLADIVMAHVGLDLKSRDLAEH